MPNPGLTEPLIKLVQEISWKSSNVITVDEKPQQTLTRIGVQQGYTCILSHTYLTWNQKR